MRRIQIISILLLIIALAILPLFVSTSLVNAGIQMLIAALFASAFNVLAGQGGMLSFGHAAYFGIGTFATIHAMNAFAGEGLLATPLLPIVGAVFGGISGLFAGWFSTQRSGVYFSMITLALAELLHALAPHLTSLFGGEAGISSMRMPAWGFDFGSSIHVYYLVLCWTVLGIAILFFITRTPLGRLCVGLRENAHRLKFMGYNVHRVRLLVFVVSATFSGLAGALLAMNNEAANYVLFDISLSAQVVLNAYIGGIATFLGPAIGAAAMSFFGYVVSDTTRNWLLYQGIIFVFVMMYMPTGLFSVGDWWLKHKHNHSAARLVAYLAGRLLSALLFAIGVVFFVEFLSIILNQDYQAKLQGLSEWPAVNFMGYEWLPGAAVTWIVPLLFIAAGTLGIQFLNKKWQLHQKEDME